MANLHFNLTLGDAFRSPQDASASTEPARYEAKRILRTDTDLSPQEVGWEGSSLGSSEPSSMCGPWRSKGSGHRLRDEISAEAIPAVKALGTAPPKLVGKLSRFLRHGTFPGKPWCKCPFGRRLPKFGLIKAATASPRGADTMSPARGITLSDGAGAVSASGRRWLYRHTLGADLVTHGFLPQYHARIRA